MRIEHLSGSSLTKKRKISELFREHIHTIARLDKLEQKFMNGKLKELGWLIEKTESIMRYRDNSLIPVSRMCSKLIRKQNAYSDILKIAIKSKNKKKKKKRGNIERVKNRLRQVLPRIMAGYIQKRNISLPALNKNWQHLVPNKFILVFLKKKGTHKKNVAYSKLFYAASASRHGSRNAHLILTSIYDYGFDRLQKEVKAGLKFSPYLKVRKRLDPDLYKGELFPTYLSSYFDELPSKEKCFIIDMMSIYGNPSRDYKTIEQWKRDTFNGNECVTGVLDPTVAPSSVPPIKTLATKISKNTTYSKNIRALKGEVSYLSNPTRVKRMTDVEIIMISVLVLLLISSTVFLSVYCTYTYKMKHVKTLVTYNSKTSEPKPTLSNNDGSEFCQVGEVVDASGNPPNKHSSRAIIGDDADVLSIHRQENIPSSLTICESDFSSSSPSSVKDFIISANEDDFQMTSGLNMEPIGNTRIDVTLGENESRPTLDPDLDRPEGRCDRGGPGKANHVTTVVAGDDNIRETDL